MTDPAILIEHVSKTYGLGPRWPADPIAITTRVARRLRGEDARGDTRTAPRRDDLDDEDELDDGPLDEEDEEDDLPAAPAGKRPREKVALRDVSLEVAPGTRLAILGRPGSGKTTLLKVLARMTPPTSGRAVVRGRVAPMLDVASSMMDVNLTGRSNAYLIAQLFGVSRRVVDRQLEQIFAFAGVPDMVDVRADKLSSRHFRRVGLSTVLHLEADVLLVDERFLGNDVEFAEAIGERLRRSAEAGVTLLFAAGEPDVVRPFCEEAVWMAEGQILDRGTIDHVASLGPYRRAPRAEAHESPEPRPAPPLMGLDALPADGARLVELLVGGDRTYAQAAQELGLDKRDVRDRAHRALARLTPGAERLLPATRAAVADHLLGEPSVDPAQAFATPEARVWARMVTFFLEPKAPGRLSPYPREAPDDPTPGAGASAPVPEPDVPAAGLLTVLHATLGPQRTRVALSMATDKAIWKDLRAVKWQDIAEAAGLAHEEGRTLVDALAALRRRARADGPGVTAFDGDVELGEVRLRSTAGEPLEILRPGDEGVLEVDVIVRRPGVRIRVELVLESADGPALRLVQPEAAAYEPGRVRVSAQLPVGALCDGRHAVGVAATAEADDERADLARRAALAFDVHSDDDAQPGQDPELLAGDVVWDVARDDFATS